MPRSSSFRLTTVARGLAITAVATLALSACGTDEADFLGGSSEVGHVPGSFQTRLAPTKRDQIDNLQSQIDTVTPGVTASFTRRFGNDETAQGTTTDENGTKLSDLLSINVPGTDSSFINQRIFNGLAGLTGDDGNPWFDLVDTGKKTSGPYSYDVTPIDDPRYADQYYLEMIRWQDAVQTEGFDDRLATAVPVVVAVLDTGVLAAHEDLSNVMWTNTDGAVGLNATSGGSGSALNPSTSGDANGHGTHVAGIIGAEGVNGKGIHGVAYIPGRGGDASKSIAEIMNVQVLDDDGAGTSDEIAVGIKWAAEQHWAQVDAGGERENQKLILNMSLGGPFETEGYDYRTDDAGNPQFSDDMFNYVTQRNDVLIIVAAGNETCGISGACDMFGESFEKTFYYPCSYQNVLCVAASTHEDTLAGFSNRKASVGLTAPGFEIISTTPTSNTSYGQYSGTSQATPVTAGAAAVIWSLFPDFTADQIKLILQNSAATIGDITNEISSGVGRLDLKSAYDYAVQLTDAGQTPDGLPPASVQSEKLTATPPPGTEDANAPSRNQGGRKNKDKGSGSGGGCGVIGVVSVGSLAWLGLIMLAPVALWRRRR